MKKTYKKVMIFGTFDGLHPGHLYFIEKALKLAKKLVIVVARDKTVQEIKKKLPHNNEDGRLKELEKAFKGVKVRLGSKDMDKYKVIEDEKPDLICLGYDQHSFDKELKAELKKRKLGKTEVMRFNSYKKWKYKSAKLNRRRFQVAEKGFRELIARRQLIHSKIGVLLAVSGGPDSMAMLNLFLEMRDEKKLRLRVAHVNYGLRKRDSDNDQKLVETFCKENEVPISVLKMKKKLKSENEMREARYSFFSKLKKQYRMGVVAVAHNKNDQAETVLMRFLRGSGIKGLGGMRYKREDIIRPLLDVDRKDILAYLKGKEVPCRIDKSNLKNNFLRNRIRNELMKRLEKGYNPNIQERLVELSRIAQDDYKYLNSQARGTLRVLGKEERKKIKIDYIGWRRLPTALQRETLRESYRKLVGDLEGLESVHLEEVMEMLKNQIPEGEKVLLGKLQVRERYDKIEITLIK